MLYLDHEYKNDCEHKIEYDILTSVNSISGVTINNASNTYQIYKSTNDVYLIKMNSTTTALSLIMPNTNCSVIEIAPGLYKLVVYAS